MALVVAGVVADVVAGGSVCVVVYPAASVGVVSHTIAPPPKRTQVFNHYATSGSVTAVTMLRMCQDYDISPTFIHKSEIRSAIADTMRVMGPGEASAGTGGLTMDGFVEALARVAIVALSKPVFSHLYPTEADKIGVLLEMWGVADPLKLQQIQGAM